MKLFVLIYIIIFTCFILLGKYRYKYYTLIIIN